MPNCIVFPPEYNELVGCDVEVGSIVAVAFIEDSKDFTDITDPSEWTTLTYSTDILIHQEVRGSYPKATATEIAGKGKQDVRIVGRKHEVTFRVSAIKNNDNYWNTLNRATNYKFAMVIGQDYDLLLYVNNNVSIDAAPEIQEGLDTEADWMVTVKWSDINVPSTSDVPTGIFE